MSQFLSLPFPAYRSKLIVNPAGIKIYQPGVGALAPTLGTPSPIYINPERVESGPNILFVKFDSVSFQQLSEFLLKRNFDVMLFLSVNVFLNLFYLGKA